MTSEHRPSDRPLGDHPDEMVGRIIADRYRVEGKIGEGGMGAVWLVEHTHMRKRLALKVLHGDFSTHAEIVARFEREAMAAANIDHPNVVQATDFGKLRDGSFYLVLEYVEGTDLRKVLGEGPLATDRAVHIVLQILFGLKRAHELRIVHRDLKPENILLVDRDGDPNFVKILDFGIARVHLGSLVRGHSSEVPLTRAGTVYGTPEYMSPEQALGQTIDGRADLYAVGVLLFEMLSGRRPYEDKDKVALLGQHVAAPIPSLRTRVPRNVTISPELEAIVTKLLAKEPADRYPDAESAARALYALGFVIDGPVAKPATFGVEDAAPAFPLMRGHSSRRIPLQSPDELGPHSAPASIRTLPHAPGIALRTPQTFAPAAQALTEPTPRPTPSSTRTGSVLTPLDGRVTAVEPSARRLGGTLVHPRIIAALVAGLVVGGLFVILSRQRGLSSTEHDGDRRAGETQAAMLASAATSVTSTASASPSTSASEQPKAALRTRCLTALGKVASGETEAGLGELVQLAEANPDDPSVLRALTQGYSKARRHSQALSTLRRLLALAPESKSDPLLDPVFDDAVAVAQLYDEVLGVLVGPMAPEGARVLYAWAWTSRGPSSVRLRAMRSLTELAAQKRLSPAVRAAVELERAGTCRERRLVLEKFQADFDDLALPTLRQTAKNSGCGPLKKQDCWPCLRDDRLAEKVLDEVEKRTSTR